MKKMQVVMICSLIIGVIVVACSSLKLSGGKATIDQTGQVTVQGTVDATGSIGSVEATGTVGTDPVTGEASAQISLASDSIPAIHFDFDSALLRPADMLGLTAAAELLKKADKVSVKIEGHCDERGTGEYNLALGRRRAISVKNYLVAMGVSGDRISTISYGKEKPVCVPLIKTAGDNACHQANRRAEFVLQANIH